MLKYISVNYSARRRRLEVTLLPFDTPKNVEELIIYEVFARAYGSFEKVGEDLDRIKSLGVDVVWFMPIHPTGTVNRKGKLGSPYAIRDYRAIDSNIGTENDFKKLVKEIHSKGMKVMMDVVFNHMATDSVLSMRHPDWFIKDGDGNPTRKVDDWSDIIDFNFTNYDLVSYLVETLGFWIEEFDIDGFRCDVAGLVPITFWNRARSELSRLKDLIWLSESKEPYLYQAFDVTYDYDSFDILRSYFNGKASLSDYTMHFEYQKKAFDGYTKLRFLENHDQERIASRVPAEKLRAWTAFLAVQKGALLLYNGQEFALDEKPDIFDEFHLDFSKGDEEFQSFVIELMNLRKRMKAINHGTFDILKNDAHDTTVAVLRRLKNDFLLYIGNLNGKSEKVTVEFGKHLSDRYIHAYDHVKKRPKTFYIDEKGKAAFEVDDYIMLSSVIFDG